MLIYSSFRLPTRGESSPTALVSWYYGLSKCTIPFLSSSTISTAGLANVIALTDECCCVHGTECVGNEAARKQVTQLYYQQIGTTRDEMSSPDLSSCWCRGGERGKNSTRILCIPNNSATKSPQPCVVSVLSHGLSFGTEQHHKLCLWVAVWSAGTAWAKESRAAGLCRGSGLGVLCGGSMLWTTHGAVGLAVFSTCPCLQAKVLLQI